MRELDSLKSMLFDRLRTSLASIIKSDESEIIYFFSVQDVRLFLTCAVKNERKINFQLKSEKISRTVLFLKSGEKTKKNLINRRWLMEITFHLLGIDALLSLLLKMLTQRLETGWLMCMMHSLCLLIVFRFNFILFLVSWLRFDVKIEHELCQLLQVCYHHVPNK